MHVDRELNEYRQHCPKFNSVEFYYWVTADSKYAGYIYIVDSLLIDFGRKGNRAPEHDQSIDLDAKKRFY